MAGCEVESADTGVVGRDDGMIFVTWMGGNFDMVGYSRRGGGNVSSCDGGGFQYVGTAEQGFVGEFAGEASDHADATEMVIAEGKGGDSDGVGEGVRSYVTEVHEVDACGGPVVF